MAQCNLQNNNNNNNNYNGQKILQNMKTWLWNLKISGSLKTPTYGTM
jgi:hypothetical protein